MSQADSFPYPDSASPFHDTTVRGPHPSLAVKTPEQFAELYLVDCDYTREAEAAYAALYAEWEREKGLPRYCPACHAGHEKMERLEEASHAD